MILRREAFFWTIIVAILSFQLFVMSFGISNNLVEEHHFRQSQTAITSFYLNSAESIFHYQTPVLGEPYQVPFEFPIYQYLGKVIADVSGVPLVVSLRIVGIFFQMVVMLSLLYFGAIFLKNKTLALYLVSLVAVSPLYLYWGRTVMIESTALGLSLLSIVFFLQWLSRDNKILYFCSLILICMGLLVKVTTGLSCLGASLVIYWVESRRKTDIGLTSMFLHAGAYIIISIGSLLAWVHHTDKVKMANAITSRLTSAGLKRWNFGTISQKIDVSAWFQYLQRTFVDLIGIEAGFLILVVGLIYLWGHKLRGLFAGCVIFFLGVPMVFTNLHFVHNYYPYANGIFALVAIASILVVLKEKRGIWISLAFFSVIVGFSVARFYENYFDRYMRVDRTMPPSEATYINDNTFEEDIVLVFGIDWNSLIHYYSKRKGLAAPEWIEQQTLKDFISGLNPDSVGAIAFCNESTSKIRFREVVEQTKLLDIMNGMNNRLENGCDVFVRDGQ